MNMKKVLSAALALCMTAALSVPAFAVDSATTTEVTTAGSSTSTELKGTIKVTTLKVSVPTSVPFEIDPNVNIDPSNPKAQMGEQAETKIVNKSMVPVYAKVDSVTTSAGVTLVNKTDDLLTADKNVMVSYKQKGAVTTTTTTTDWLTSESVSGDAYVLNGTDGKIAASDGTTNPEVELELCAMTKRGWSANDTFTVTPVIVISATAFGG